jgi:hypothetical protein
MFCHGTSVGVSSPQVGLLREQFQSSKMIILNRLFFLKCELKKIEKKLFWWFLVSRSEGGGAENDKNSKIHIYDFHCVDKHITR